MRPESYYHLDQAQNLNLDNFYYFPLTIAISILPLNALVILPILLATVSIYLLIKITELNNISIYFSSFFLLFLILSPSFIQTFSTISTFAYFTFLLILGYFLLFKEKKILQILSLVPFFLATFFDVFSSIFLLLTLLIYMFSYKSNFTKNTKFKTTLAYFIIGLISFSLVINIFFLDQNFFLGPFHVQQNLPDLISDLGGLSGVSLFILILGIIGFIITWKKKRFYPLYILLLLITPAFFINSEMIFLFSILLVFFATIAFMKLFDNKWTLETIKRFTFLLILLGILFSSLSYIDRISVNGPFVGTKNALSWIKENTASDTIVFSSFEESYYIRYFAERTPFNDFNALDNSKLELSNNILMAEYLPDLIPLLEENSVSVLYITPNMREQLPEDYGLLFLLKSETFKLVYSHENYEVWTYSKILIS